jgi:hypothetical protein
MKKLISVLVILAMMLSVFATSAGALSTTAPAGSAAVSAPKASITDALEILSFLAGLPSVYDGLDNPPTILDALDILAYLAGFEDTAVARGELVPASKIKGDEGEKDAGKVDEGKKDDKPVATEPESSGVINTPTLPVPPSSTVAAATAPPHLHIPTPDWMGEPTVDGGWRGGSSEGTVLGDISDGWGLPSHVTGSGSGSGHGPGNSSPLAGKLTGSELRDNDNWAEWLDIFGDNGNANWKGLPARWQKDISERIVVTVTDEKGKPVRNATVELFSGQDGVLTVVRKIWIAKTDHNGVAYVFNTTPERTSADWITVSANGKNAEKRLNGETAVEIELKGAKSPAELKLDLMFVIDTTGSMGSELRYLGAELEDVIKTVREENANLPTRLSINYYKDRGDVYVVQPNPFTDDFTDLLNGLRRKNASGGGDWPEALDEALMNAVFEHEWLEDSVKIMFVVLDAPAHNRPDAIANMITAMNGAAERGIRIVPLLATGMGNGHRFDIDVEFQCRALAIATGGTFTHTTSHSGVGSGHVNPQTTVETEVEMLNALLVRIINEYLGQETEKKPIDIPDPKKDGKIDFTDIAMTTGGTMGADDKAEVYLATDLEELGVIVNTIWKANSSLTIDWDFENKAYIFIHGGISGHNGGSVINSVTRSGDTVYVSMTIIPLAPGMMVPAWLTRWVKILEVDAADIKGVKYAAFGSGIITRPEPDEPDEPIDLPEPCPYGCAACECCYVRGFCGKCDLCDELVITLPEPGIDFMVQVNQRVPWAAEAFGEIDTTSGAVTVIIPTGSGSNRTIVESMVVADGKLIVTTMTRGGCMPTPDMNSTKIVMWVQPKDVQTVTEVEIVRGFMLTDSLCAPPVCYGCFTDLEIWWTDWMIKYSGMRISLPLPPVLVLG